jgi:hypothetical protein
MVVKKSNVWGVTSLVTGILSCLMFIMPYFGLPLGIVAMVSYGMQRKNGTTGVSTAGLVLGIIGTIINAVVGVIALVVLLAMAGA